MATVAAFVVTYGSAISAGAAIVGVGASVAAKRQAANASKARQRALENQAKKQRQIASIRAQRERVPSVRARRRAVATVEAREQASGVSSSTSAGTIGSIQSQTSSAMGAASRINALNEQVSIFNQQQSSIAQRAMDKAGQFGQLQDFSKGAGNLVSIFQN